MNIYIFISNWKGKIFSISIFSWRFSLKT